MRLKALQILSVAVVFAAALPGSPALSQTASPPIAAGPFVPSLESLKQYRCPEWFRDAKFGIWAHWGPQAVPMNGDWYARGMYEEGNKHYKYHREHYGHPSTNGYKDIIPLWKAENWNPDRLMALYKKAGARYFVSMGSHHDNFFLWNSKLHRWNSVQMGPNRDVVGEWRRAARRHGLKFGVSEHLGASFTWLQSSHKADKAGPLAGVPYDGANPAFQDLYHSPAEPGDTGWYSTNPRWQRMWFDRIRELVDAYRPDLLYTDGGVPFGNEVGLGLIAHYYNSSAKANRGVPAVVYTCKQRSEGRWIEDLERGVMAKINPDPWQTDTSIGDWYYNRNWQFRPVSWTIHMLADIVAKNGNLLLNVVQRPDGSLDPEVEKDLQALAEWNAVNGEAIFGTRPWLVYGEGKVRQQGGHFREDFNYTSSDVRFTTKGRYLYAIALGWPKDGKLVVRSLASTNEGSGNRIGRVSLLGHRGVLRWTQTAEGLVVQMPTQAPSPHAVTLKITGKNLSPAEVAQRVDPVLPDTQGQFTLAPNTAEFHGSQINQESRGGQSNIGFWDKPDEWVSWKLRVSTPGTYKVSASTAALAATEIVLQVGRQELVGKVPATGNWDNFQTAEWGALEIGSAGDLQAIVRPKDAASWRAVNLRSLRLEPMK